MKNGETKKFTVVSQSEGTMSEIFYMTGKDWTASDVTGIGAKYFNSKDEAEQFVNEFNGGENDLYVSQSDGMEKQQSRY